MSNDRLLAALRQQLTKSVQTFNRTHTLSLQLRFRAEYAYVDVETEAGRTQQVGRIDYRPEAEEWTFVPFHFAKERYDPHHYNYAGWDANDGTLAGTLEAAAAHYLDWDEDNEIEPVTQKDKDRVALLIKSMREGMGNRGSRAEGRES